MGAGVWSRERRQEAGSVSVGEPANRTQRLLQKEWQLSAEEALQAGLTGTAC